MAAVPWEELPDGLHSPASVSLPCMGSVPLSALPGCSTRGGVTAPPQRAEDMVVEKEGGAAHPGGAGGCAAGRGVVQPMGGSHSR